MNLPLKKGKKYKLEQTSSHDRSRLVHTFSQSYATADDDGVNQPTCNTMVLEASTHTLHCYITCWPPAAGGKAVYSLSLHSATRQPAVQARFCCTGGIISTCISRSSFHKPMFIPVSYIRSMFLAFWRRRYRKSLIAADVQILHAGITHHVLSYQNVR